MRGGINPYLYGEGNPLSRNDPLGLLSFFVHGQVTLQAFEGTGFSERFAWEVARANIQFDFIGGGATQEIDMAYSHGMRPPNESPAQAKAKWESFVNYQIGLCNAQGLGWAIHGLQDAAAAGHQDFQEYGGILRWRMIPHMFGDVFPSSTARVEALATTRKAIEQFREKCGCR